MTEPAVHTTHVDTIYFFGTSMRIMMSGGQTRGSFCLIEVRSPVGNIVPLHLHWRETETIHVLEGGLTCVVDGKHLGVGPGETIFLPADVAHSLITGERDTRTLLYCTPAGFDDSVRAVGTAVPTAPHPAAHAHARETAKRFGIEFVS